MNVKKILQDYSIGTILLALITILLFILSLGFITPYYQLFFEGTSEMYELYLRLQDFNDFLFESALVIILFVVFSIPFDIHKKKTGILNISFLAIMLAYVSYVMSVLLQVVPFYTQQYLSLDLSTLTNYTPTTLPLTMSYVLIGLIIAVTAGLLFSTVGRFVKNRNLVREAVQSYE